jgi:HlyD family secretion protein
MKTVTRMTLLALVAFSVTGCRTGEAAEGTPSLQTVQVEVGDLIVSAEAVGSVEPIRRVEVKSKASGEILRLHADVGDEVQPGALLADIDPRDVQNRFDQMQADLRVAEARMEISESQRERSNQLLAAEVITQQEHESARLESANSEANLVKAKTNFELAELQLMDVRIRAPMAGTIIQKNVEEGVVIQSASGNVSGGTTLFIMANLQEMQVRTLVDETDMGDLAAGMETSIKVEAFPDRTFIGTVTKIEPQAQVEQNVTMFPVIVSLDNRAGLLKPGMNAEVEIKINEARGVLVVPNSAIVQTSDVGPAAMALGLDIETLDLTQFASAGRGGRGGRGGASAGQPGEGQRGAPRQAPGAAQRGGGAAPDATGAPQAADGAQVDVMAQLTALRAKVDEGELTQDSMRVLMGALRGPEGSRGRAGGSGGANGGFRGAGAGAGAATAAPPRQSRAAVVFVLSADSVPEPRLVQIGLNDWDKTQIVSGVEEGEALVVVGAAQLLAQQQAFLAQMRERMGGTSPFGGGGSTRGMGGGRGR